MSRDFRLLCVTKPLTNTVSFFVFFFCLNNLFKFCNFWKHVTVSIYPVSETDQDRPQIFLSYQWDSQDEVKVLRDKLERSGLMCWMDIGQLGGGDQLYNKIDEALRHCKVRYDFRNRENYLDNVAK